MERPIVSDEFFLSLGCEQATAEHLSVADDLVDTLLANRERCVGLAANMIGRRVCVIAFFDDGEPVVMLNPEIIRRSEPYDAEEGCLSLTGVRPVRRWNSIKVRWQNRELQTRVKVYSGYTAQIIQHETDHCNSVVI